MVNACGITFHAVDDLKGNCLTYIDTQNRGIKRTRGNGHENGGTIDPTDSPVPLNSKLVT